MRRSTRRGLVLLEGGRAGETSAEPSRAVLHLVRGGDSASDLQAAIEETVAAAREVRREIERRIAGALEELQPRAPEPDPR